MWDLQHPCGCQIHCVSIHGAYEDIRLYADNPDRWLFSFICRVEICYKSKIIFSNCYIHSPRCHYFHKRLWCSLIFGNKFSFPSYKIVWYWLPYFFPLFDIPKSAPLSPMLPLCGAGIDTLCCLFSIHCPYNIGGLVTPLTGVWVKSRWWLCK